MNRLRQLLALASLALFASCDVHIHDGDANGGYFRVRGGRYPLEMAVQYYPPVELTRESDLVRIAFGTPWEDDEPGIELLLWTPPDTGLAAGGYVWDPITADPYGIADGMVWGEDHDWRRRVVDGRVDVSRWGFASCTVDFDLLLEGGVTLSGHYSGELWER